VSPRLRVEKAVITAAASTRTRVIRAIRGQRQCGTALPVRDKQYASVSPRFRVEEAVITAPA